MKLLTLAVLAMLAVTANAQTNVTYMIYVTNSMDDSVLGTVPVGTNSMVKTNWCDRIPSSDHEQAVKDLAAGGAICKVLGCSWDEGQQGRTPNQFLDDWYQNIKRRTCRICGKRESKTEGSWK